MAVDPYNMANIDHRDLLSGGGCRWSKCHAKQKSIPNEQSNDAVQFLPDLSECLHIL